MVGYDPTSDVHLSESEQAAAGAISGVITRAIAQPLDVVKVRFQLQIEPIKKGGGSTYHGVTQAFIKILREEKMQALWKGHVPAQMLSISFGLVTFSSFEILTKDIGKLFPIVLTDRYQPAYHFTCGGLAGCIATVVSQPMDVVRTRLVAQGEPKIYPTIYSAVKTMYKQEGARCFFRGLSPTLLQIVPQSGLMFGFYSFFVNIWEKYIKTEHHHTHHPTGIESMVCGSLSGVFSKSIVYPLDLMKKRLQVVGFDEARKKFGQVRNYKSLRDCTMTIFREEGIKGLFKGIVPSVMKAALSVGITFCSYEQVCEFMETHWHDNKSTSLTKNKS
ncbi:mitochondrial thiamine pyrophosphate carrier-like [Tubulanus polymorphus]|uniref:mitochondrial thiamine pyrophosphate carrier-like n=1 Tax=Tubulanus polymorphus TaxID=672921 RepID=UPI003DA4108B